MDIAYLQAFISVAREKSFSKASENLFVTQPAVSKRVASLESELGVMLFNRVARSVSLTEAGRQLLPKAQELVNQAAELQRYASNLNDDISGDLSVSIAHHIGLYRMQSILRKFTRQYPRVNMDIRFEDSEQAFQSVEQGDIEFGIITLPSRLPEKIRAETVWYDDLHVVVSNDHPLADQRSTSVQELSQYSCVLPTKETETHQIMQRLFTRHKLKMQIQMETNSLESLKVLVGAGIGWSLLPKTMLDDKGIRLLDIGQPLSRQLGMVFHTKRSLSNAATALCDLVKKSTDPAFTF